MWNSNNGGQGCKRAEVALALKNWLVEFWDLGGLALPLGGTTAPGAPRGEAKARQRIAEQGATGPAPPCERGEGAVRKRRSRAGWRLAPWQEEQYINLQR